MLKKNKKGFSFVEVIVALAIFFIFFMVFFEIKIYFIKTKIRIHEDISYMNLQVCMQQTFLKKYSFEELEKLANKAIYYDIKTLDIKTIARLDLKDYSSQKPEECYIEVNITKGLNIEIKGKVYKDKLIKKEFFFVKGQADEERYVIN